MTHVNTSRSLPYTLGSIAYFSGLGLGIGGMYLAVTNLECSKLDPSCLNQRIGGIAMAVIGVIAFVASFVFLCVYSACTGVVNCCTDVEKDMPWNK